MYAKKERNSIVYPRAMQKYNRAKQKKSLFFLVIWAAKNFVRAVQKKFNEPRKNFLRAEKYEIQQQSM